jgi:hypothetical protein
MIRRASVVPFSVPISSPHGTGGVAQTQAAVIPRDTTTDADFHPADFDGTNITFFVGPGTDIGLLAPGRNYVFVRFHDGLSLVELAAGTVDVDTGPVVTADEVARRLRLPLPLSDADRALLEDAVEDATADVEAYLGRPIRPQLATEAGVWPAHDGHWLLQGWPLISVVSATAETDTSGYPLGTYTVTYLYGLDAADDPALAPIRRYVVAAAMNDPQVLMVWRQRVPETARTISSLSVEGQTVAYTPATLGGGGAAGTQVPGALPNLKSLSRWRVAGRRVFQRPGLAPNPLDSRHWWR